MQDTHFQLVTSGKRYLDLLIIKVRNEDGVENALELYLNKSAYFYKLAYLPIVLSL